MKLYDDQEIVKSDIYNSWGGGAHNVLAVMPTGAGKTAVFSNIMGEYDGASVAIAHRSELVAQMALALARNEVHHKIIGSRDLIREVVNVQMRVLGRSYYNANARTAVAAVNTLVGKNAAESWYKQVGLWVTDEAHHLLKTNVWGKAVAMFPNARGLGVTATPLRSDGRGLGRHADGVFDAMVVGIGMRDLINIGRLADYRIFAPESDIDLHDVPVTASGDYSPNPLRKAVHKSRIVGDIVNHYLRIAPGALGLTFTVDVASSDEQAAAFRAAGVPAISLSGSSGAQYRAEMIQRYARGEFKQLCTCDLISEGFDLPACEVAIFGRPTQSYGLYVQQFGRPIRQSPGKTHAVIIDPVGNVMRHGLPDKPRIWTLNAVEKTGRSKPADVVDLKTCLECFRVYPRSAGFTCPYCNTHTPPAARKLPAQVDGDLRELDPDVLARMRGEIDAPIKIPYGAGPAIEGNLRKIYAAKCETQAQLRDEMALWAGRQTADTDPDTIAELQRKFYINYGVDVLTAQTLNTADAKQLIERLRA